MGVIGRLLGSDNVIEKVSSGIDKSILTEEERLDYHQSLLRAYEPFKIAQRFLALIIVSLFGLVLLLQIALVVYGSEKADAIGSLDSVEKLGWAFISVVSLYFTGGVLNSWMGKKK